MNYKKAVGAGLLVFAIQFSLVSVLSNLAGPFLGTDTVVNYLWQAVMVLVLIGIVYYTSKWYFIGNKATPANGAILGIILAATSVSITLLQAIPAIMLGRNANGDVTKAMTEYFTGWPFLFTVAITLVTAICTAYIKQRKVACNVKDAIGSCMPDSESEEEKGA